jgi:salicylate hydroxylase/6-hydroxynicotinate 3-monooxygenase
MGAKIEQRYGAPDFSLHRAALHAALASINPSEVIHFAKKLVGLDRTGARLLLTFADGTGGGVEADAVIGAYGVHSTVLEILFGTGAPRFTGKVNCSEPKSTIASNGGVLIATS